MNLYYHVSLYIDARLVNQPAGLWTPSEQRRIKQRAAVLWIAFPSTDSPSEVLYSVNTISNHFLKISEISSTTFLSEVLTMNRPGQFPSP